MPTASVSPASMTLLLWKAPLVDHPDETSHLLEPYYERGDASAFEPSAGLATVSNELRRRYPDMERGPWADALPPKEVDRILRLAISWSADDAIVKEIVELAREHDLTVFDPQGPGFYLPRRVVAGPIVRETVGAVGYLKIIGMIIVAASVFLLGWWIRVPVLNWILMIVGAFFVTVTVFLLVVVTFPPGGRRRPPDTPNESRPA